MRQTAAHDKITMSETDALLLVSSQPEDLEDLANIDLGERKVSISEVQKAASNLQLTTCVPHGPGSNIVVSIAVRGDTASDAAEVIAGPADIFRPVTPNVTSKRVFHEFVVGKCNFR